MTKGANSMKATLDLMIIILSWGLAWTLFPDTKFMWGGAIFAMLLVVALLTLVNIGEFQWQILKELKEINKKIH